MHTLTGVYTGRFCQAGCEATIPPPFHYLYVRTALTVVYDPLRPTHDCSGAGVTQRTCTGGSVGVELHHARPPWLSRRERHGAEDAAGSCGGRRRVGESERAGNAGGAMVRAWIANPGKQTLSAC